MAYLPLPPERLLDPPPTKEEAPELIRVVLPIAAVEAPEDDERPLPALNAMGATADATMRTRNLVQRVMRPKAKKEVVALPAANLRDNP